MRYIASPAQLRWQVVRWSLLTVPVILALGFFSAAASGSGPISPWFEALAKPATYPPAVVFPVVWSILYVLMGVALAMVIVAAGASGRGAAVAAFLVQLVLNLAWSPVFFGMHQLTVGLVVIGALAVALVVTIVLFARVRTSAAWLLAPYLAWVLFAALLNYQFLAMNPDADGKAGPAAAVRIRI